MASSPRKSKLRDLSRQPQSAEETTALTETFFAGTTPLVVTILGKALIEHELEQQLRKKFKRKDDSTGTRLTDDGAPLGTLSAKLTAGYAFGLYDEISLRNLNLIREIRNVFAHSKRLITFDEPSIAHAIRCISMPNKRNSRLYRNLQLVAKDAREDPRLAFQGLCVTMYIEILRSWTRSSAASTRNYNRYVQKSLKSNPPFHQNPAGLDPAGSQQPSGLGHIFDPTILAQQSIGPSSSQKQKKS